MVRVFWFNPFMAAARERLAAAMNGLNQNTRTMVSSIRCER